jgi:Universal stress protein UspA and related nucleotide-binding proteins
MIKNFIVPIDFSEDSLKGLELAMLFSTKCYVNIQMVYVQKKTAEHFPSAIREEYKIAKDKFEKIVLDYSPKLGNDSKLRYIIKDGPKVYEEVVNQAESYKECIISASTHGASGFEEFFIGSNAFKIISATTRPVIAIRKGSVPADIRKIVLPIDNMPETRQKVPMTAEIASLFGAEIHVIEVATSHSAKVHKRLNAYSKQVSNFLKGQNIAIVNKTIYGDNVADITVEYATQIGADMISIITEQKSSITTLIIGNYAQQILNKAVIPVLNITPREIQIKGSFSASGN